MPLTDPKVKQAMPKQRDYKLSDEKGLYLLVKKNGSKYWRYKYRFAGKEKLLALGVYPEISLKKARGDRDEARIVLKNGIDPSDKRRAEKIAGVEQSENSFKAVAFEWLAKQKTNWSESHFIRVKRILVNELFPLLGNRPVASIIAKDVLTALRKVESRGAFDTTHRVKQIAGQVFRYAVATGRAEHDPTSALKGALTTPTKKHLAAITDPKEVGRLLIMLDGYVGTFTVRNALQLAPLVFARPAELRHAEPKEIHLDKAEWHIPGKKMKMGNPHIVPLSTQAVEILTEQLSLTGQGRYVFPSARSKDRPMSENAILAAMRAMGISKEEMTGHGFRAMARTILDEVLGFRVDLIEHQLAHAVTDVNGHAYNRTTHLLKRKEMMQKWADYLDNLKAEAIT